MPVYMNATQIYNALIQDGIINCQGSITFNLNNISINVQTKDTVGHMIQDWLEAWAISKNIYLRPNPSTQEFPDFYLNNNNLDGYLEVKSFDRTASPNFDLANFDTYVSSLLINPKKIDADYLIFGYTLINGVLTITDLWLKKIWEICTNMEDWDLRLQVKYGVIHNIRPASFASTRARFIPFNSRIQLLNAIQSVLNNYNNTSNTHQGWLANFTNAYIAATGNNP